ncbi:hypothetical protein ACFE04_029240 [Oxalis oulophora]
MVSIFFIISAVNLFISSDQNFNDFDIDIDGFFRFNDPADQGLDDVNEQGVAQNMPDETNLNVPMMRPKQTATHQVERSDDAAKRKDAAEKKRKYREKNRLAEQEEKNTNDKAMKELQTKCQHLEEKCKRLEEHNKKLQATSQHFAHATASEKSTKKKYKALKCEQKRYQEILADLALKLVNNTNNKNVEDGIDEIVTRHLVDGAKKHPKAQNFLKSFRKEIDAKAKDVTPSLNISQRKMEFKKISCAVLIIAAASMSVVAANEPAAAPGPDPTNGATSMAVPLVGSLVGSLVAYYMH